MVALTAPGRTIPMPTAPADWSPPPATTGVPAARPTSAAAAGESRPVVSGPSWQRGQERRLEFRRLEHLGRPAPVRDVEQQRARGIGHVGRPLTGQLEPDVVLRQQDAADA